MARPELHRDPTYEGYQIQLDYNGSRVEILAAIVKSFEYMWNSCGKRLCVSHFTVNIPRYYDQEANTMVRWALRNWRQTMSNRKIKAEYIWARERGNKAAQPHPHYHVFIVLSGKDVQSAKGVAEHLNRLLANRLGEELKLVYINPPQADGFQWAKKVSAKLDNLADAIHWASYIAKSGTKEAPHGQKTFGFSRGFQQKAPVATLTLEEDRQEEAAFELADLSMTDDDWMAWGGSHLNLEEILDFDPRTGGSKNPKKASSAPLS